MILQILILSLAICTSVDKHIGPFPNIIGGKFHDLARPYLADINVDCHIKRAAYDFAKEIQPERKNHRAVFDALQLQQCNMERPPQDEPLNIPDIEYPGFTVFVDGHSGNDKNSGTIRDPVKTIERGIALTRGVSGNRTLYLREGEYYLSKPLLLTKIDDDLTISSYNNEKVVLSGAKEVKVDWKPYRVGEFDIFQGKDAVVDIKPAPGAGVAGRVKFAGKVPSLEECQELCAKDEEPDITFNLITCQAVAPLAKGDEIGKIEVYKDGVLCAEVALVCAEDVQRASFFDNWHKIADNWQL